MAANLSQAEVAMAVLRIPDEKRTLREEGKIREHLAGIGIEFERWPIAARRGRGCSCRAGFAGLRSANGAIEAARRLCDR